MKNTISVLIGIIATAFLLTVNYYFGYKMGYQQHKDDANKRAVEMILNNEIPNYYMEIGTVDYLINNKSGELEKELKKMKEIKLYFMAFLLITFSKEFQQFEKLFFCDSTEKFFQD